MHLALPADQFLMLPLVFLAFYARNVDPTYKQRKSLDLRYHSVAIASLSLRPSESQYR